MTLQNKGSYKDKIQLYVPSENDKEIIYKTRKLLKRDGKTLSKFFIEKVTEYYHLHEPGNPQQTLTTILELGHAYRVSNCSVCGAVPYAHINNGKKTYFLCRPHFEPNKAKLKSYKIL